MANRMDAVISKTRGLARGVKARLDGVSGLFATLVEDHEEVTALIQRVQRDPEKRKGLWPKIRIELLAHERAEIRELYPVLRTYASTRAWADHHEADASKLEEMVERLDATPVDEEVWGALFDELARALSHHIQEEETEIFPLALSALGPERARELEAPFTAAKKQFAASA